MLRNVAMANTATKMAMASVGIGRRDLTAAADALTQTTARRSLPLEIPCIEAQCSAQSSQSAPSRSRSRPIRRRRRPHHLGAERHENRKGEGQPVRHHRLRCGKSRRVQWWQHRRVCDREGCRAGRHEAARLGSADPGSDQDGDRQARSPPSSTRTHTAITPAATSSLEPPSPSSLTRTPGRTW